MYLAVKVGCCPTSGSRKAAGMRWKTAEPLKLPTAKPKNYFSPRSRQKRYFRFNYFIHLKVSSVLTCVKRWKILIMRIWSTYLGQELTYKGWKKSRVEELWHEGQDRHPNHRGERYQAHTQDAVTPHLKFQTSSFELNEIVFNVYLVMNGWTSQVPMFHKRF